MKIAIVGAGRGGTKLIKSIGKLEDVQIVMVVDMDQNTPGISLAKQLGIKCSQRMDDIQNTSADTIIDATGNEKVLQLLKKHFDDSYKIINSQAALLMIHLVELEMKTLHKLNNQMGVIHNTATVVENQLEEISSSIDTIHDVNEKLLVSTKNSNTYINESDKIVQYVNNIAKQSKILGINATIEAARAGEHGRGFSVVANEIQTLANSSANFAKEINKILVQLSHEIKNVHDEVNRLDSLSEVQVNASEKVNEALKSLINETN